MGFRVYRRIKLFGGVGLNVGKRGVSWSARTKLGSFGSKGVSIKTGIKGLSFQQRFKKSKRVKQIFYRPTSNNYLSEKPFSLSDFGITISVIAALIFIVYNPLLTICMIILIFLFVKIINEIKNYKQRNTHIIQDNDSIHYEVSKDGQYRKDNIQSSYLAYDNNIENDKTLIKENLLTVGQLITLENFCVDFLDLSKGFYIEGKINDKFINANNEINKVENYKLLVLHDICNIFHLLDISLLNGSIERQLWYSTVSYFMNNSTRYDTKEEQVINRHIGNLLSPNFFVFSDISKHPFSAFTLLKENKSTLTNTYKSLLKKFLSFVTTIDFNLTFEEQKLMNLIDSI